MNPQSPLFVLRTLSVAALLGLVTLVQAQRPPGPPPVPAGVKAHRDLAYVERGHERHRLDLFVPENAEKPLPLIVWVHGGGWKSGSKDGCPPLAQGYAQRGYAIASVNYRLSSHAPFPAQLEDCKTAIRWLRANASAYNIDPDRIGVWGSSAGGHLVALLGTTSDVKDFDVGPHFDVPSAVQCVMDDFGPTDFLQMDAHAGRDSRIVHNSPDSPESLVIGGRITAKANREKVARANPITYVSAGDPPFLINHGDEDPLVPHHQSELLFNALQAAGVPVRFNTVKGGGHGAGFGGEELVKMRRDFFAFHLQGESNDVANWPAAMRSGTLAISGGQAQAARPPETGRKGPREREKMEPPRRGLPSFDELLRRNDPNRDGRVTRKEFRGNPALFNDVDVNRDNVMTREEYETAFPNAGRQGAR